jgi:hypothetical protein
VVAVVTVESQAENLRRKALYIDGSTAARTISSTSPAPGQYIEGLREAALLE